MAEFIVVHEDVIENRALALYYEVVDEDDVAYPVDAIDLEMQAIDNTGAVVKTWASTGASPALTVPYVETNIVLLTDATGFIKWGYYKAELVDATNNITLGMVDFNVDKDITIITAP